jgi:L-alanine-DL-glutamate epimerase-like enolase superfamily enzyme
MNALKSTDITVRQVRISYETFGYRTPIKFGGRVVTSATLLNVTCEVVTRSGRSATGFGSMPLGNTWAYPTAVMDFEATLGAMKALAARCASLCEGYGEFGHPVDLGLALEEQLIHAAAELGRELKWPEAMPKLAVLVTGSAFDAALHDAFGKAHGVNVYHTYGRDFMSHDLSRYLGAGYEGKWLDQFVRREPVARLPLYHLVGALDPLAAADVVKPIGDGLPETLSDWIAYNGLTHLKIKLNGDNLDWDLERVLAVDGIASAERPKGRWQYSLDFNEKCKNVAYLIEMLRKLRERSPAGFERVQYVEQPTARDLKSHPENRMHEAAKLRPVVIDESLVDLESLMLAREMGYTGAALKACKGQGHSLVLAAAAQNMGMFLCVQDLTCPGASLIQSASLSGHVPGVSGIECNSRQYCPAANEPWQERFPGIFKVTDGSMDLSGIGGPGLGAVK